MANPSRAFNLSLQNESRFGPSGLQLQGALDEFVLVVPKIIRPGWGEKLVTAHTPSNLADTSFAAFVDEDDSPPSATAPTTTAVTWDLGHIEALPTIKASYQRASQIPNNQLDELVRFYRMAAAKLFAAALANGAGIASKQWLGFGDTTFPNKTTSAAALAAFAATKEALMAQMKIIDDEVVTHEHGRRASCYVTTALGRRNIESAMERFGIDLVYRRVHGVFNEVLFCRGKPVLVSSGLSNDALLLKAPVYAMDLTQVFFFATSGDRQTGAIETVIVPTTPTGSQGVLVYITGALISGTPVSIIRTDITTTLSA